jgi:hypothetical protein
MTTLNARTVTQRSEAIEDSDILTVALPLDPRDSSILYIEDLPSGPMISLKVWDKRDQSGTVYTATIDATSTANPNGEAVWKSNSAGVPYEGYGQPNGYVFIHQLAATTFAQVGGRTYVLEYSTPSDDFGTIYIVHEHKCLSKIGA